MKTRELRLAIEKKLNERRDLLARNALLREDVNRKDAQLRTLRNAMRAPIVGLVIERQADAIVDTILQRALEAAETIAEQTYETGDYVIGVHVPDFYIKQHLTRADVNDDIVRAAGATATTQYLSIDI